MSRRSRRQHDLDSAVASATGEDLRVIRRRGFSLIDLSDENFDPEANERAPLVIDWDEQELSSPFDHRWSVNPLTEVA